MSHHPQSSANHLPRTGATHLAETSAFPTVRTHLMSVVSCYATSPASQTRLPLGTPNSCHHSCPSLCESFLQSHFSFFQSQFSFSELQLLDSVLRSSNSVSMDFFLLPIDEFGKASASACESSEYPSGFQSPFIWRLLGRMREPVKELGC